MVYKTSHMPEDQKKYLKATLFIGICTFLSKVLGLLRNTLISATYGATSGEGLADCYIAAFRIPDTIYILVASGIVSILLIPYFLSVMHKKSYDELNRACSGFINLFLIIISVVVLIAAFAMPFLVRNVLLTGWTDGTNINLVISMSRIILIQVFFFTIASVLGSYLNAIEKFTAYSLAMLFYAVGIIIGITVFSRFMGIEGVAWGVAFGGLMGFSIQLLGAIKNKFRFSLTLPKPDRELIKLTINSVPRIFTLSSSQIISFFFVNFASFLVTGSMLIYDNVESIALTPYSLLAMSISTTAFPVFIKFYNAGNFTELYKSLFEKLRMLVFFLLPTLIFILVFRREFVSLLVGYGRYNLHDIAVTSDALFWFVLGTPFFAITLIIVKFYYAEGKTMIPMLIAIGAMLVTVILSYFLSRSMDVAGLALGRSIGNIIQCLLLFLFLFFANKNKHFARSLLSRPVFDIVKIVLICLPITLAVFALQAFVNFPVAAKLNSIIKLVGSFIIFAPVYFLVSLIMKIPEANLLFRRKKPGTTN